MHKHKFRKLWALLLGLCMVVGLTPGVYTRAETRDGRDENTVRTIYFKDHERGNIYVNGTNKTRAPLAEEDCKAGLKVDNYIWEVNTNSAQGIDSLPFFDLVDEGADEPYRSYLTGDYLSKEANILLGYKSATNPDNIIHNLNGIFGSHDVLDLKWTKTVTPKQLGEVQTSLQSSIVKNDKVEPKTFEVALAPDLGYARFDIHNNDEPQITDYESKIYKHKSKDGKEKLGTEAVSLKEWLAGKAINAQTHMMDDETKNSVRVLASTQFTIKDFNSGSSGIFADNMLLRMNFKNVFQSEFDFTDLLADKTLADFKNIHIGLFYDNTFYEDESGVGSIRGVVKDGDDLRFVRRISNLKDGDTNVFAIIYANVLSQKFVIPYFGGEGDYKQNYLLRETWHYVAAEPYNPIDTLAPSITNGTKILTEIDDRINKGDPKLIKPHKEAMIYRGRDGAVSWFTYKDAGTTFDKQTFKELLYLRSNENNFSEKKDFTSVSFGPRDLPRTYYAMWSMLLRVHANEGKFANTSNVPDPETYANTIFPWNKGTYPGCVYTADERHFAVPYGANFDGISHFASLLQPSREGYFFNGWVINIPIKNTDGSIENRYYKIDDTDSYFDGGKFFLGSREETLSGKISGHEISFTENYDIYASWTKDFPLNFKVFLVTDKNREELVPYNYGDKSSNIRHAFKVNQKDSRYYVQFNVKDIENILKEHYGEEAFDGKSDSKSQTVFDLKDFGGSKSAYTYYGSYKPLNSNYNKVYIDNTRTIESVNLYLRYNGKKTGGVTLGFYSDKPYYSRSDKDMIIEKNKDNKSPDYFEGKLTQELIDKVYKPATDSKEEIHNKMGFKTFLEYVDEYTLNGEIKDKTKFPHADAFMDYVRRSKKEVSSNGGRFLGWYDRPYAELSGLPDKDTGVGDSKDNHKIVDKDGKLTEKGEALKIRNNLVLYAAFTKPVQIHLNLMYNESNKENNESIAEDAIVITQTYLPGTKTYNAFAKRYEKISRDNLAFGGWYKDPDTKGTPVDLKDLGDLKEDTTLYAKWLKKIRVTFYYNAPNSNQSEVKEFAEGQKLEYPEFTRPGYVIENWILDRNDPTKVATGYANDKETELYANWIRGTAVKVIWTWNNFEGKEEVYKQTNLIAGRVLEEYRPYEEAELNKNGFSRIEWYETNEKGEIIANKPIVFDGNTPVLTTDKKIRYYKGKLVQDVLITVFERSGLSHGLDFYPNASVSIERDPSAPRYPDDFEIVLDFSKPNNSDSKLQDALKDALKNDKERASNNVNHYNLYNFNVKVNGGSIQDQKIKSITFTGLPFDILKDKPDDNLETDVDHAVYHFLNTKEEAQDLIQKGEIGFSLPLLGQSGQDNFGLVLGKTKVSMIKIDYFESYESGTPINKMITEEKIPGKPFRIPSTLKGRKNSKEGFADHELTDFYNPKDMKTYKFDEDIVFEENTVLIANWHKSGETTVYYIDSKNESTPISLPEDGNYDPEDLLDIIEKKIGPILPSEEDMVLDTENGIFGLQRGKDASFRKIDFSKGKKYSPKSGDKLKALWRVPRVKFDANGSKFIKNNSSLLYVPLEKGTIKEIPDQSYLVPLIKNNIEYFFTGWQDASANDPNADVVDLSTRRLSDGDVFYARWKAKKKLVIEFKLRGSGSTPTGTDDLRDPITVFVEPGQPMTMQLIDDLLQNKMGEDDRSTIKYVDIEKQVTKVYNNIEDQTTFNGENLANLKGTGNAPDSNEIKDNNQQDEVVLFYEYVSNPVTISFDVNTANEKVLVPKPRTVEKGDSIRAPKIPKEFNPEVRAGYDFKGWYKSKEDAESLQNEVRFPFHATESITLIAAWEGHPVYIIYRYNNGMGNETILSRVGDPLPEPKFVKPEWPGMKLEGWYVTIGQGVNYLLKNGEKGGDSSDGDSSKSDKEAMKAITAEFGKEIEGPMLIDAVWKFDPNNPAIKELKSGGTSTGGLSAQGPAAAGSQAGMQAASDKDSESVMNSNVAETGEKDYAMLGLLLLAGVAALALVRKFRR